MPSAFWLFKRELIESIGLLDEKIFYAPEDVDFCVRAWLKGWKIYFYSRAKVIHRAQEISRKKPFGRAALSHLKGLAYYFWKYGYALKQSPEAAHRAGCRSENGRALKARDQARARPRAH
jgi:GT2 family glycosyltransferase